jgi:guanylate kinase
VTPILLVLSSPSGGGKTTIARLLKQGREDLGYSVSATTRAPRAGERDGVDYHYLTREEFLRRVDAGDFLEYATYNGHLYGTLRSEIERILGDGRHAVLDIEINGARQVRAAFPSAILVFVLPPSARVLASRLAARGTEDPDRVRERLALAAEELRAVPEYDFAIINDELIATVASVAAVLDSESRRVARHPALPELVEELQRDIAAEAARITSQARA